ncbi:hypothetical protein FJT64_025674 [Amphibalanus amphitrite]|uniref:Uncharacterized protein n=1 Tax=Amphibalanus amphitrite TaxID=1232801 RepID=A0A6A4WF05_AMPAM|nr:hypothetical protein FJT64_025674 [Amphibalanus amphitrite]
MVSSKKTGHSVDSPMGRSSEWMERLNSYFTSVGPDVARSLAAADTGEPLPPRPPRVCSGAFAPQPATLPELSTALGRMGTSRACGADGITIEMLKLTSLVAGARADCVFNGSTVTSAATAETIRFLK